MTKEKEYRISKRGIRQVRPIGGKRWQKRCSVEGCTKLSINLCLMTVAGLLQEY